VWGVGGMGEVVIGCGYCGGGGGWVCGVFLERTLLTRGTEDFMGKLSKYEELGSISYIRGALSKRKRDFFEGMGVSFLYFSASFSTFFL